MCELYAMDNFRHRLLKNVTVEYVEKHNRSTSGRVEQEFAGVCIKKKIVF